MRKAINVLASGEISWWTKYKNDWRLVLGYKNHSHTKYHVDGDGEEDED